jgi:hypothetical protein
VIGDDKCFDAEIGAFSDITQRWVVFLYRRVGTTKRSHLQGAKSSRRKSSSWTSWLLKTGLIGCPETSVQNYHSTLRKIPEERISHLHHGGSLKCFDAITGYIMVGRDRLSVQWLATGWTVRGSNPGEGEIFCTRPDRLWGSHILLYNGYRVSFSGVKRPGRGVDHPPPCNGEVKERVDLYLYSPSNTSWPLVGWTLLLPFTGTCWKSTSCADQRLVINISRISPVNM